MERIDSSRPQRSQRAGAGRTMATAALAGGTALLAVALPPTAAAQPAFPDRPLRLIVHVPPGGALDFTARVVGSKLTESLGQQVLVENRAGAGGIAASELVSKATPDGHTLLLSSSTSHGVAPVLYRKLPYDAFRDFTHVALVAILPALMAINADLPAKTVKEFIALAKAKPGGFLFASAGNGSGPQLMGEQFKLATGIPMTHVPYKGAAAAVTDIASGQVQVMFDSLPSLISQVKAGRLRVIAALSEKRAALFPDVQTMTEAGYPSVEGSIWTGLSGPAGMPAAVVDRLAKDSARLVAMPDVQERFAGVGGTATFLGPTAYVEFIRRENRKWAEVIRVSGAVPD
ncbi:MAG: tripartite tricarboxylate transporter substrate binding protein [Rhodocyclaceae bacterium]|jgi:tripartite-type tricarboxylate transporter receptor subunit TctC|nr:tripartite tricarboxylate transporter substrate binding protein [Rhodocyclaceae bacterium]MCE2980277.1 tripartite tricarboxylate transporter substrate binding protein [Betaproteobacteria bacterium]MCA3076298.1 tripartite tricarboxylate transporter substrate binding protein [Rhodocyclaceae bacterium]MCA3091814.1 tripartite tricarboxylate transporter substrate binding protein [Rhodocyclaceae bacterium]MCA3093292.1 tripartite tricarboxylate transporter substrate binding protein [Rhodocyclaceae 